VPFTDENVPVYMGDAAVSPEGLVAAHTEDGDDGESCDEADLVSSVDDDRDDDDGPPALEFDASERIPEVEEWEEPTVGNPDDWVAPPLKVEKGEPPFSEVDNPMRAGSYVLRPKFAKPPPKGNGKYMYHCVPTGATAVPPGEDGTRKDNGWTFHYNADVKTGAKGLSGVTHEDPFPTSRRGKLDKALLAKLGLTKTRMIEGDALFFYQLVMPMCDVSKSGIKDDPRSNYYVSRETFSNIYAAQLGAYGSYGHAFDPTTTVDHVRWDGTIIRDAVLGGCKGAFYRRFDLKSSQYDDVTAAAMSQTRWLQIKRVMKLNDNSASPKRGEEGYDPTYKYRMLPRTLVDNTNALTETASLDLGVDETTWPFQGFGEAKAGLITRVMNKPGVSKGGQEVLAIDRDRVLIRMWQPRHKLQQKIGGLTSDGQCEVLRTIRALKPMVQCEDAAPGVRQIFKDYPAQTFDNFFSGEGIMEHEEVGDRWPLLMTTARNRLPKVAPKYLCKEKTAGCKVAKAARSVDPITLVKGNRVHISFQSTSSCNFGSVNTFSQVKAYTATKMRGRGKNRYARVIEMNTGRFRYPNTYWVVDRLDHLIKMLGLHFQSWKYWHSPMQHYLAAAIITAFSMYQECADGGLENDWHLTKQLGYHEFCEKLAVQMCQYNPADRKYPGDDKMRVVTKEVRKKRRLSESPQAAAGPNITLPGSASFVDQTAKGRLVGSFAPLYPHLSSCTKVATKGGRQCQVCGMLAHTQCSHKDCGGVALHFFPQRGESAGKACYLEYHDRSYFGLAVCDAKLVGGNRKGFAPPNKKRKEQHAGAVAELDKWPAAPALVASACIPFV
jgi:hypothetical protein